jgi:hypothetical protein
VKFDGTINLGEMIAAVGLLVVFLTAHRENTRMLSEIKTKVDVLWRAFETEVLRVARREGHRNES